MKRKLVMAILALAAASVLALPAAHATAASDYGRHSLMANEDDSMDDSDDDIEDTDSNDIVGIEDIEDGDNYNDSNGIYDDAEDDDDLTDDDLMEDDEPEASIELTKDDIRISPSNKTIRAKKSFAIRIIPQKGSDLADYSAAEWDEICADQIEKITYRSTKNSVASVSKNTGKVKGKKKGVASIKTTVTLANGETAVFTTKVHVTK